MDLIKMDLIKMVMTCMDLIKLDLIYRVINQNKIKLKFINGNFLKIKKEKDMLIYLFFCLKCILIIIQKN